MTRQAENDYTVLLPMRKPSNNTLPEPPWLSKPKQLLPLRNGYKGGFLFQHMPTDMEKILEENYALNTLIITPTIKSVYNLCTWFLDTGSY